MRVIPFICIWFVCIFMLFSPALADTAFIYVSPDGHDAADGSLESPLGSIEAALAHVRENQTSDFITIILREGTYRLESTIPLSDPRLSRITFQAYPGENPLITGDTPLSGWQPTSLQGQAVWALPYEAVPRAVYGAEGNALQNARWPKEGMLLVEKPVNAYTNKFTNQRAFYAAPNDIPGALDGAYLRLLHLWKDELAGVNRYNENTNRITLNRKTSMTIFAGDRYWLENVLSVPLLPGEWGYDAEAGLLYYAPMPGESPDDTVLYAGRLERLFHLEDVDDIAFEGIAFARTAWDIPHDDSGIDFPQAAYDAGCAIYVEDSERIAFRDCTFFSIGAGCIRLDKRVRDVTIEGCGFADIGAQAIFIHGRNTSRDHEATARIRMENNHINGYGRNFLNAVAVLIIHARDIDVRHNEIHDGTYTAVSAGWVWGTSFNVTDHIRIENNLIYDIGKGMLADMGGIYTLGVQKNTVLRGNVIYNVSASDYGGWGIYLDEGASGILVENNIAHHCSSLGFHQHDGVYNTVRNNIFAFNLEGQVGSSDRRGRGSFLLEGNLLVGDEAFVWRKYEVETIDFSNNLYFIGRSPFQALEGAHFALIDDPDYEAIGFVQWDNTAGRLPNAS